MDAKGQCAGMEEGVSLPLHAGWVLLTTGSGGRANRKHVETLVAMGSMTGDGGAIANDDVTFADA